GTQRLDGRVAIRRELAGELSAHADPALGVDLVPDTDHLGIGHQVSSGSPSNSPMEEKNFFAFACCTAMGACCCGPERSIMSHSSAGRSSRNREGVRGMALPRLTRCAARVSVS